MCASLSLHDIIGTCFCGPLTVGALECGMASHYGSHNQEGVTTGAKGRSKIPDIGVSCRWVWRLVWIHFDSQKGLLPEAPQWWKAR